MLVLLTDWTKNYRKLLKIFAEMFLKIITSSNIQFW